MEPIRVYMIGDCEGFGALRDALAEQAELELVGEASHVAQATTVLAGGHLDCILLATGESTFPATEVAAIREQSRAPLVLVAHGPAGELLEQALDAEVSDVLLLPQLTHNVVFMIRKAAHVRQRTQVAAGRIGRVVTIFSPKGGTGKTVVATNLAAALAKREGKRTLLLDLDLQFGDTAIMLGLELEKTIYDLVVAPGELDSEKLAGYVTKHPSGLDLLAAPLRPEDAELVVESKVTRLLEVARGSYDVIVVDTSPFFHGPMLATLDRTDDLLVLCGLDVATLKNVGLALQTLELLSFPASRIRYVMNRATANVGVKPSEVEAALKVKIAHQLPSDQAVPISANRGTPAVLAEPRADFSKAIAALAKELAPAGATAPKRQKRRVLSLVNA
ncbi:MAG TPA: AAA family ATPase [Gaiellaceae bacterium]|nr:AAA family ATPase [Gaiellaceae bacterium]